MPRQLWNEGRVVGYSAYEIYVKHSLSVNPDCIPAAEKEWLASMLAMGSSMLLRIGVDPKGPGYDGVHYRDIQFPERCRLCAANTIMASFFDGEGYVGTSDPSDDITGWATKVTSYGSLLMNTPTDSPSGKMDSSDNEYPADVSAISDEMSISRAMEYIKISDGIIIQPGTWTDNPKKPPQKDFSPTLSEHPRLRIAFKERVTTPFFLLLTGFTNRTVADGTVGFDTAVNTLSPADGDFLGPWAFPWANKVIFSISPSLLNAVFTTSKSTIGVNADDDDHAVSCYTTVGNETITALSMTDSVNGEEYGLTGIRGDILIPFSPNQKDNSTTYTGSFTWSDLISMLHENKKCTMELDLDLEETVTAVDITSMLVDSHPNGITACFRFDGSVNCKQLKIPVNGDTWGTLDSADSKNKRYSGYFRLILALHKSKISSVSKFVLHCCALLKDTFTLEGTSKDGKQHRYDEGFYWRGNFDPVNTVWNGSNVDVQVYPIVRNSDVDEATGTNGVSGTPVIVTGVIEGLSQDFVNTYELLSAGYSWMFDSRLMYSHMTGSNNDRITLLDKSFTCDSSTNAALIAGGDKISPFKAKGADISIPDLITPANYNTRILSTDEYSNILKYSAVHREISGTYPTVL